MRRLLFVAVFYIVGVIGALQLAGATSITTTGAGKGTSSCAPTLTTIYSTTLTTNESSLQGTTNRTVILIASLSAPPSCPPTRVRLTLEANSGTNFNITNAYFGALGASACDGGVGLCQFAATPVAILSGGGAAFTITAGVPLVTDFASFAYTGGEIGVVFSYYASASPANDRYKATSATENSYVKAGSDAATVAATGYSAAGRFQMVSKIEVQ